MLIESVPNVSEGRRLEVVDQLAAALDSIDGVYLLDRTSDASHNRSVFTLAGEHEPVLAALDRLVAEAIPLIDLNARGQGGGGPFRSEHAKISCQRRFVTLGSDGLREH